MGGRVSTWQRLPISEAVREALAVHRRAGNPVAVWRNDRVEWIPANEIPEDGLSAVK